MNILFSGCDRLDFRLFAGENDFLYLHLSDLAHSISKL